MPRLTPISSRLPLDRAVLLAALLGLTACNLQPPIVTPAPIPVAHNGGLYAYGATPGGDLFPLLIDTGTVLTTRGIPADAETVYRFSQLRLFDRNQVPRALFRDLRIIEAPLGTVGLPDALVDIGGVMGGDFLQLYSLRLRYGDDPSIALMPRESACSCALADAPACEAVFPFRLSGGGNFQLGSDIYTYPATRVTVDACLQPVVDPWRRGLRCEDGQDLALGYRIQGEPGVDVRFLVATGFSGVLLGATAYDRLCDAARRYLGKTCPGGSAAALLASAPTIEIRFPSPQSIIRRAARIQLGDLAGDPPLAALALIGREGLLSACGELARSRRLRAHPPPDGACDSGARPRPGDCLQLLTTGGSDICGSPDRCNDMTQPAAAYIELTQLPTSIDLYLVDDAVPILVEANNDVRPRLSDIEGVIGNDLLALLEAQIDYPNRRIIAHCAPGAPGCTTYPRLACATGSTRVGDCGPDARDLCNPPSSFAPGGPICLPAPVRTP